MQKLGNELVTGYRPGLLIAIDGPAGSGKSTVAKRLAVELGIGLLDTGAMYRALTWECLRRGVLPVSAPVSEQIDGGEQVSSDLAERIAEIARCFPLRLESDPQNPQVFVGDIEATAKIRSARVTENVSTVSGLLPVRECMVDLQRKQMLQARQNGSGMVAEGRDITTVVCPEADVKVLLQASAEARLRRRVLEIYGDTSPEHLQAEKERVYERDAKDSRVTSFLTPAEGVTLIDSSNLSIEQVVEAVKELIPVEFNC